MHEMSETRVQLPQIFIVKYLGKRPATRLWGIKHTRKPVDEMVQAAKSIEPGNTLPLLQVQVSVEGLDITELKQNLNKNFEGGHYPVDIVSYGVQDVVYTRVFAIIVVRESDTSSSLECHAFVCDRCESAKKLTFALDAAFKQYNQLHHMDRPRKTGINFASFRDPKATLEGENISDSEA